MKHTQNGDNKKRFLTKDKRHQEKRHQWIFKHYCLNAGCQVLRLYCQNKNIYQKDVARRIYIENLCWSILSTFSLSEKAKKYKKNSNGLTNLLLKYLLNKGEQEPIVTPIHRIHISKLDKAIEWWFLKKKKRTDMWCHHQDWIYTTMLLLLLFH